MLRGAAAAVSLLLASAPNCPDLYSLTTHGFSVPSVNASNAVAAVDPQGMRLTVLFTASNQNAFPISIDSVDYRVVLQGQPLFAGTQANLNVPEHGSSSLQFAGVAMVGSAVYATLRPGQTASYIVTGVAHVQSPAGVPVDVEFEASSSFVVPQGLPAP
jgi:hypothetical protein